jgi:hypothetical protein
VLELLLILKNKGDAIGNVIDLWIVFLEGSQSIHSDLSYP